MSKKDKIKPIYVNNKLAYCYDKKVTGLGIVIFALFIVAVVFMPVAIQSAHLVPGFDALEIKPGSTQIDEGQWDSSTAERTIFVDPSAYANEDDIKELAYALYQMGNIGMMVSPVSAYYSTGKSDATTIGNIIPLLFQIIDIRNNITGESYRLRYQTVDSNAELDDATALFARAGGVVQAERRYYIAGKTSEPLIIYEQTKGDLEDPNFYWDKKMDNSELLDRYDRTVNPIPYVSAATKDSSVIGKKYGIREMEYTYLKDFESLTSLRVGTQSYIDIFGADAGNTIIPIYKDCADFRGDGAIYEGATMGRYISYEKTDQHIFFSKDPNMWMYSNIDSATVTYNAEGGFYTVHIVVNCEQDEKTKNNYTCADTCWAIRDSQASNNNDANFTKVEVEFELWDNGYFKTWKMFENWYVSDLYKMGFSLGEMGAIQDYMEYFTYYEGDCGLTGTDRDFWTK